METLQYDGLSIQAYKQLKLMILSGKLKPGEKLLQEKIAQQLGVSRTPLHRAFQMLENSLLVKSIPRKGFYVREINLQEIADAFECREAIEGIAIRRVIENITPRQIEGLEQLFIPYLENMENIDWDAYENDDQIFHNSIIKISGNQILMRMEMLGNILHTTYLKGLIRPPKETIHEHLQIIDAIKRADFKEAEQKIRAHFYKSRMRVLKKLEEDQKQKYKDENLQNSSSTG